jgi:hypothetical protein
MSDQDHFSAESLRAHAEFIEQEKHAKAKAKAKKLPGKSSYAQITEHWEAALTKASVSGRVWSVAWHLNLQFYRAKGQPFILNTAALLARGIARRSKIDALNTLQHLGLISTQKDADGSLVIAVRHGAPIKKFE